MLDPVQPLEYETGLLIYLRQTPLIKKKQINKQTLL